MKCTNCGAELKNDAKFCLNCGAAVTAPGERVCPSCGARNSESQHYCSECGWPLDDSREREEEVFSSYKDGVPVKRGFSGGVIILLVLIALAAFGGLFYVFTTMTSKTDVGETTETEKTEEKEDIVTPAKKESTYQYVVEDVTFEEAVQKAKAAGGHLATIESIDEYNKISNELSGLRNSGGNGRNFFLGARQRSDRTDYSWLDENGNMTETSIMDLGSSVWLPGEPSFIDSDTGLHEGYLEILYKKADDRWYFNDTLSNPLEYYPELSGKIGYIIEFD